MLNNGTFLTNMLVRLLDKCTGGGGGKMILIVNKVNAGLKHIFIVL